MSGAPRWLARGTLGTRLQLGSRLFGLCGVQLGVVRPVIIAAVAHFVAEAQLLERDVYQALLLR
jgi:hypothetical protein